MERTPLCVCKCERKPAHAVNVKESAFDMPRRRKKILKSAKTHRCLPADLVGTGAAAHLERPRLDAYAVGTYAVGTYMWLFPRNT